MLPRLICLAALLTGTVVLTASPGSPHGGGLDQYGCHHNRIHGGYHCHRGAFKGGMFESKTEMLQQLEGSSPAEEQAVSDPAPALEECREHIRYGAPSHNGIILCRVGYVLSYNIQNKVADWVAYHLTAERLTGQVARTNDYREDPDLPVAVRSQNQDYRGSGFARGHLAPAGSMVWSVQAMSESFLLSNMAPQIHNGFNNGIWKALENRVRKWTTLRGELYVVTGPVYRVPPPDHIGVNQVTVPFRFYKVIFDPIRVEAIAFILNNGRAPSSMLPHKISTVDEVEMWTGLDFLSQLDDPVEDLVESTVQADLWPKR